MRLCLSMVVLMLQFGFYLTQLDRGVLSLGVLPIKIASPQEEADEEEPGKVPWPQQRSQWCRQHRYVAKGDPLRPRPLAMNCGQRLMRMMGRRAMSRISSPTTSPGYILFNNREELFVKSSDEPKTDRLAEVKGLLYSNSRLPLSALPSLSAFKSLEEFSRQILIWHFITDFLELLYRYYENQETPRPAETIRKASAPSMFLSDLMSVAQKRLTSPSTEHADEPVQLGADDLLSLPSAQDLPEHIECANVLKKRRARMRRHKHKKRLRKNRFKNKK